MKTKLVYIDHYVAQAWGINAKLLNNKTKLLRISQKIAKDLNLNVVKSFVHRFEPHGLSMVLVISESHLAIHTWPELKYMNIDVLSCSPRSKLEKLEGSLEKEFKPTKIDSKKINY